MVYVIRTLEMYLCSAIPSSIILWILTKATNSVVWDIICFFALIVCMLLNYGCWYLFIMNTHDDTKEFYKVNTVSMLLFITGAFVLHAFVNPAIFSAVYASMRAFEMFGASTILSVVISSLILILWMIIAKTFTVRIFGLRLTTEEVNRLVMMETEDESMILQNIKHEKDELGADEKTEATDSTTEVSEI